MLSLDSIHVWRVRLDAKDGLSAAGMDRWRSFLSEVERQRADSFHREEHRLDYITAHAALRAVLGHSQGIAPQQVRFHAGAGQKPALTAGMPKPEVRFNLSHTQGFALIGLCRGMELGIDVEWQRPLEDLEGMARTVMSGQEFAAWGRLPADEQTLAFYNLWSRKEAYLKAIGLGLFRSLQEVSVPVSAATLDMREGGARTVIDSSGEGLWLLTDISAPQGYSASACWEERSIPSLIVHDLIRDDAEWQL